MSEATRAKSAKTRANIAAKIIKTQNNVYTRAFEDCFEMGDGDEVMENLITLAKEDGVLAFCIRRKDVWVGAGEYGKRLRDAVKECLSDPEKFNAGYQFIYSF